MRIGFASNEVQSHFWVLQIRTQSWNKQSWNKQSWKWLRRRRRRRHKWTTPDHYLQYRPRHHFYSLALTNFIKYKTVWNSNLPELSQFAPPLLILVCSQCSYCLYCRLFTYSSISLHIFFLFLINNSDQFSAFSFILILLDVFTVVTLLDYGAGNVRSVRNAIRHLGFGIKDVSFLFFFKALSLFDFFFLLWSYIIFISLEYKILKPYV